MSNTTVATAQKSVEERYRFKPYVGSSHHWALGLLAATPRASRILDIGSGVGVIGRQLKELGFKELYSVEIDDPARKECAAIYQRAEKSIEAFRDQKFDLVLLLDLLEHLTDPFSFLRQVVDLTKPGSRVLISLPNVAHWSVRLPLLLGFFPYADRGILDRTHFQFFTRSRVKELIGSDPRLKIVEFGSSIEPVELLLPRALTNNPIFAALSKCRMAVAKTLPGFFAYQHLVLVERTDLGGMSST